MKNKPTLADVMTADPETVHLGQPLSEVYVLLKDRTFHHVPVIEAGKPIGLVAASDILRLVYDAEGSDERQLRIFLDHQFNIQDAMTEDVITMRVDEPLRTAAELLGDGTVHSVVVVDDEGTLAGIVTTTDLIRVLHDLL